MLKPTLIEHGDPVTHGHGLHLIVGHVESGGPQLTLEVHDASTGAAAQLGIEIAQRFVHQKDIRLTRHGSPESHPLFLTTG